MPTILKTKNSVTTTVVPTTLQQGELAVNITDKKLWVGNAATTPVQLFGAGADGSFVNLAYTGTLTGGTGIVNLGSGQFYKDASGLVGIGTSSPAFRLDVGGSNGTNIALRSTGTNSAVFRAYVNGAESGVIGFLNGGGQYFETAGTERMRIDSSGNVGIGTSSPTQKLAVKDATASATVSASFANNNNGVYVRNSGSTTSFVGDSTGANNSIAFDTTGYVAVLTNNGTERMRITSAGLVQILSSSTNSTFTGGGELALKNSSSNPYISWHNTAGDRYGYIQANASSLNMQAESGFLTLASITGEAMRIISGGNVGIGTSSPVSRLDVRGSGNTVINSTGNLFVSDGGTAAQAAGEGGQISLGAWLNGDLGSPYPMAVIKGITESSTTNTNSGALLFGTAASSATVSERMRITSAGYVFIGRTTDTDAAGLTLGNDGFIRANRDGGTGLVVNRNTDDGTLVSFRQAGAEEGTISVSGSTVSYNGGHLSRWSQLPDGSKDESIVKGTVMSNLDNMCVWEKDGVVAENEQLNKMKVSDVEGDTNVAGVFVNWTIDADYGVDDMNVAMTGDMIIRIADGVVVQKGDLLMSAGDGTAMPQGDDIVRSKTVAKVTSNYVTCTYADGSYCVPCVLMAC